MNNILVVKLPSPKRFYFRIIHNTTTTNFTLLVTHLPLIFDWDRSYCKKLGENTFLNDEVRCGQSNVCNTFVPNFDLYTLLCRLRYLDLPISLSYFIDSTPYVNKVFTLQESWSFREDISDVKY